MTSFEYCRYQVPYSVRRDKHGLWAVAYCPVCGNEIQADDYNFVEENAVNGLRSKTATHMSLVHGLTDDQQREE